VIISEVGRLISPIGFLALVSFYYFSMQSSMCYKFLRMIHPGEPFARPLRTLWRPLAMSEPPRLDAELRPGNCVPRYALLINPFYPKDAHASFGKHVLTPTLALTSFAGTSLPHWSVKYWDENLLHGSPPCKPLRNWWV
jgi:hypothetical protein